MDRPESVEAIKYLFDQCDKDYPFVISAISEMQNKDILKAIPELFRVITPKEDRAKEIAIRLLQRITPGEISTRFGEIIMCVDNDEQLEIAQTLFLSCSSSQISNRRIVFDEFLATVKSENQRILIKRTLDRLSFGKKISMFKEKFNL